MLLVGDRRESVAWPLTTADRPVAPPEPWSSKADSRIGSVAHLQKLLVEELLPFEMAERRLKNMHPCTQQGQGPPVPRAVSISVLIDTAVGCHPSNKISGEG